MSAVRRPMYAPTMGGDHVYLVYGVREICFFTKGEAKHINSGAGGGWEVWAME